MGYQRPAATHEYSHSACWRGVAILALPDGCPMGTWSQYARSADGILLRTVRHSIRVRRPYRADRAPKDARALLGAEELHHEPGGPERLARGRAPLRGGGHRLQAARGLPRVIQLLHQLPAVHLQELLERRGRPLPELRA